MSESLIALFLPSVHGGGAERAMLVFGGELAKLGLKVDLVLAKFQGPHADRIPQGVRVVDLNSSRMLKAVPHLAAYLRSAKPNALFSTITHANIAAVWAARRAGYKAPVIVRQSNAPRAETKSSFGRYIARRLIPFAYRRAAGIIAVSEGVRDELLELNRALDPLIKVIPTPVLSVEVRSLSMEETDCDWLKTADVPVVLSAGRLEPHKGMLDLIRAFKILRDKRRARLVILGQGSQRNRLEREIESLGLTSDVALVGFKANPFAYMSRAALFVLASHYEGLPNVLIQALAFGTPVVATDCRSGPREILEGGRLGKLVSVGDIVKLAEAIDHSLGLPKQSLAQELVWQRYSAEEATRLYLGMVNGGGEMIELSS
jgi:glycosyltransferase involved in cell wall biosynthesis